VTTSTATTETVVDVALQTGVTVSGVTNKVVVEASSVVGGTDGSVVVGSEVRSYTTVESEVYTGDVEEGGEG
jgi:hypothetical protein